jgi:FG-GAP-like repeat/PASTA domain/FG-GAP repeat
MMTMRGHAFVKAPLLLASLVFLGGSVSVAALLASSAPSAPSFAAARGYATGGRPQSVAIGDLNGDGKPDLATANSRASTASVLLNRGDGRFQARRDYGTGGANSVAIGDLNGDAKPDLATADGGAVSVLLNGGDGSFEGKRDYANAGAISVALGDLNGDGKPDLATALGCFRFPCARAGVSVLLNRGDGSFQPNVDYPTDDLGSDSVAIGDLNGDGAPDLATANDLGYSVSVLLNKGDGSFRAQRDYGTGGRPRSVAIGDLNGDGKLDLATENVGRYHDNVSVLLNKGDGSLRATRDYYAGYSDSLSVAIGDLNGDGKPDLATTGVSVLVNRGDGSFQAKLDYRTGRGHVSVAIGDLNGDGRLDLATANNNARSVSVLINTPGLCTVQDVEFMTLAAAKRTIARANCRVGEIRRAYSRVKRGRVISQKPKFGAVLPGGSKVDLVVSRGRRTS